MNCRAARERMLEAPPTELSGSWTGPLESHLARCPDCELRARRILEDQQALNEALFRLQPAVPVEEALAGLATLQSQAPRSTAVGRNRSRHVRFRWTAAAAATLIAMVAASVFLLWPTAPSSGPDTSVPLAAPPSSPPPVVEPSGRGKVVVFATSDPDVTVVWIEQEPPE